MRELVLGTAGHIDHGKTALVRALTGVDADRLPEEKQRGITIDLGFAALEVGGIHLAIVDVPGHERFIRNMLAGATGLDLALLVVAADDSVMPQTREHLDILRLLGLPGGVIAVTKCDLVDPGWLELVREDVRALVRGSFLEGAEVVATSAATGAGIPELTAALGRAAEAAATRADPGLFRMAIDRAFTVAGHGTVVTGTVASGTVSVGDELAWWPEGRAVRVRGLQQHDRSVERLGRGSRAALNLTGVHHREVARGQEVAAPGYLRPTRILGVEIQPAAVAPRGLKHQARYRLHLGTGDVGASLSLLEPDRAADGPTLAQLFLSAPVVAVHGQPFVLRAESPPATLGGGRVLQVTSRRIRRRDAAAIERLGRLGVGDDAARARAALANQGLAAWTHADLCREAGVPAAGVAAIVASLAAEGTLRELPAGGRRSLLVASEHVSELEERVLRAVGRLHAARPRQAAVRRAEVATALADLPHEAVVPAILDQLVAQGRLMGAARTVALPEFQPKLSQAERKLKAELAAALEAGGISPPDLGELQGRAGGRAAVVAELLDLLVAEGEAVAISPGLYLAAGADADLRGAVGAHLADGSTMTMADMRDLLGTTRKFAVPIGEYLDRIGLTRREGDLRRLNRSEPISSQPQDATP